MLVERQTCLHCLWFSTASSVDCRCYKFSAPVGFGFNHSWLPLSFSRGHGWYPRRRSPCCRHGSLQAWASSRWHRKLLHGTGLRQARLLCSSRKVPALTLLQSHPLTCRPSLQLTCNLSSRPSSCSRVWRPSNTWTSRLPLPRPPRSCWLQVWCRSQSTRTRSATSAAATCRDRAEEKGAGDFREHGAQARARPSHREAQVCTQSGVAQARRRCPGRLCSLHSVGGCKCIQGDPARPQAGKR